MKDGFVIAGGIGELTGCHAYRNGQAANFTYNGFNVTRSDPCNFVFNGCIAESNTTQHLVGFNDAVQSSLTNKNIYNGCYSYGHGSRAYNFTNDGPKITFPKSAWVNSEVANATLNVDQITDLKMINTGAFTVTTLNNGVNGQVLTLDYRYDNGRRSIT